MLAVCYRMLKFGPVSRGGNYARESASRISPALYQVRLLQASQYTHRLAPLARYQRKAAVCSPYARRMLPYAQIDPFLVVATLHANQRAVGLLICDQNPIPHCDTASQRVLLTRSCLRRKPLATTWRPLRWRPTLGASTSAPRAPEIGRASCRERV